MGKKIGLVDCNGWKNLDVIKRRGVDGIFVNFCRGAIMDDQKNRFFRSPCIDDKRLGSS